MKLAKPASPDPNRPWERDGDAGRSWRISPLHWSSGKPTANVVPSWMPDLAQAGALDPLDAYVEKYGYREDLDKIAPTFHDNWMTAFGKIYAFPALSIDQSGRTRRNTWPL
jgi:hypothetical protein